MSFATLSVISLVAIVGPLLALPRRWHLPIILGELAAGIVLGATGSDHLEAHNETFTFLADIGFVLIMFVVGSQVPVRDRSLHTALRIGALHAVGVGLLSVAGGVAGSARAGSAPVVHPARGRARSRCDRNPCCDAADGAAGADRRIGIGAARGAGGRGDHRIAATPPATWRAGCADPRGAGDHRGSQRHRWLGGSRGPGDRSQPARPARPSATSGA